jgi:autotransporter translocation and assembly factor TamB
MGIAHLDRAGLLMRVFTIFLRLLGIAAILLLALGILFRFALNTDTLRNTLRETALESVPGLKLGSIAGDLWRGFMLHDLAYADSTITMTIDSVGVRYHVWGLLNGVGDIRTIEIYRPVVLARSGQTVSDSGTSAITLPIDIRIGSIIVRDGSLQWNDLALARALQIDASARWVNDTPSVTIHRLETSVGGFGLDSTSVRLSGRSEGSVITLEQLMVATGRTLINGNGTTDVSNETLDANFLLSPLSWRDITALAGEIPLQDDLDLSVTLSGRYDALKVLLDVRSATYPRVSAGLTFTPDSLTAAGTVHTGRTPVTFTAATDWSAATPGVDLRVNAIGFDARTIDGFDAFPTSINATLLARMMNGEIDATLDVDTSTLNRVALSSARADVRYADGIVTVKQGAIRSDIIHGDFELRQRLDDPTDLGNRLDAVFTLLNLQPLAPLAGVDSLSASGRIVATLARGTTGVLRFDAELDLRNVRIDTIHVAHANSRIEASVQDIPTLSANLNLNEIRLGDMALPFAALRAEGRLHPDHIRSFIAVETQLSDKLSFVHEGDLEIREGDIRHRGTRLDVRMMSERYRLAEPFDVRSDASGLHLDALHLIGSTGAELRLDAQQRGPRTEAMLSITGGDLHTIDTLAELEIGLTGQISVDANILLDDGNAPDVRFSVRSANTVLRDVPIDNVLIEGTYTDYRIDLLASAQHANEPWLNVNLSLPFLLDNPETIDEAFFSESVAGTILLHPTKLQSLGKWFEAIALTPISGSLHGELTLGGTAGHPTFTGNLRLLRSSISAVPIDSLGVEWTFDSTDASIQLASTLVSLGQPALEIDGRIPFEMDMRRFTPILDPANDGLDLAITTRNFNLDALSLFLDSRTIRRLQGRMNGDLALSGRLDAPELTGRFEITQASAFLPEANIQISDIGVDLRFEPGRLIIQDVQARSNGVAKLTGTVDLDGLDISAIDVALKGDVIRLSDTRNALIFLTIDTRLKGGINAPKLTGTLRLDRGHLFLEEFGENQVEQVILSDEDANLLDGIALYDNLEMELLFKTERGFWVRNRSGPEMNLELTGEIDILKSKGGDMALFGTMGTNQGSVSQLGKRFIVEKGNLTFSGDAENPQLAIRSLYELRQPNDIKIWYVIGGTAAKPTFTFESDPEMDQTDIVSYTLFNRPYQQLMSWEQTMSGSSSIGNLAVDLLVDRVGELAADRLGLDVIEIDNSRTSGNSGTTIKAGKYLNDRLFVAIFQELGTTSDSQVILEYALRQHLNLVLTGSDKRKSGIDIQWKYDY